LLSNVALSVLDERIAQTPGGAGSDRNERVRRQYCGLPNFRLCRYVDDWCLLVSAPRRAEAIRKEIAEILSTMGLRLSPDKALITHIDEGLDFLGWRIQRHRKPGTNNRYYVYIYPARKALRAVIAKVKVGTNQSLDVLLSRLSPALRGWCAYFRPGGVLTPPSPTSATTCGMRYGDGCAVSIPRPGGRRSAAATAASDHGSQ